jgi:bifunctional DNA-binding transcriptional regulator/antitoxin component of YhaV-PrlF toxin-antitoxin module
MVSAVSTITSKWQVTLPEDARAGVPVKAGQRLVWEAKDGYWEVRPLPGLAELSGSLKGSRPPLSDRALRELLRGAQRAKPARAAGRP